MKTITAEIFTSRLSKACRGVRAGANTMLAMQQLMNQPGDVQAELANLGAEYGSPVFSFEYEEDDNEPDNINIYEATLCGIDVLALLTDYTLGQLRQTAIDGLGDDWEREQACREDYWEGIREEARAEALQESANRRIGR